MNLPIVNVYGRITRKGVSTTNTRNNAQLTRFTLSVPVERRPPATTGAAGEKIPKGAEQRRPWWITCLVFEPKLQRIAEALSAGDNVSAVGRLDRRRWYGDDGTEHSEWAVVVDSFAAMIPGQRFPSTAPGNEQEPPEAAEPPHIPDEEMYDAAEQPAGS